MPKPRNIVPTRMLNVALPLPVFAQLTLHLNSDVEGRVPHGAYSQFLSEIIKAHFAAAELDLAPWLPDGVPPGVYVVRGAAETIEALKGKL